MEYLQTHCISVSISYCLLIDLCQRLYLQSILQGLIKRRTYPFHVKARQNTIQAPKPSRRAHQNQYHGSQVQSSPPLHSTSLGLLSTNPHYSSPEIYPFNIPHYRPLQGRAIICCLPIHQPKWKCALSNGRNIFKREVHNHAISCYSRFPIHSLPEPSTDPRQREAWGKS